jgi:hypothetical protein
VTCVVVLLATGCNPCGDEVMSNIHSPDGALTATALIRDCGATTDFSTVVKVHRKGAWIRDHNEIVFVAKGRHDLEMKWNGPAALTIRCGRCSRKDIFREVTGFENVSISFQE